MKRVFRITVVYAFFQISCLTLYCQTFNTSLGSGYFFEGLKGVYNEIKVLDSDSYSANSVVFYATSPDYKTEYSWFVDDDFSDGVSWIVDMGSLPAGAIIYVGYFDANDDLIDVSDDLPLNIQAKPHWLKENGSVANVLVNTSNSTITFIGTYPIYQYPLTNTIVAENVKGFKGKPLQIAGNFVFGATYNYKSRLSVVTSAKAALQMNLLDFVPRYQNEIVLNPANCLLDQNLSLAISASKIISADPIKFNVPKIQFPVGVVTINLDAGFSFYATLRGQVVIGQSSGQWGFISSGGNKSGVYAILTGEGFIRGKVAVLGGVASANASLKAKARIGLGYDLVTIPSVIETKKNGGDLKVWGELSIKGLWGFWGKTIISSDLYYAKFGDTTIFNNPNFTSNPNFNTQSFTYRDTGTLVLPKFSPQPYFKTKGDILNAVWIEKENELSNNGYLLFAKLSSNGTFFENQMIVEGNNKSISNAKIGILPSGSAIITWSQNRYDITTAPAGATDEDLIKSQDVYFAIYDPTSNNIIYKNKITSQSNQSAGEANITVGTTGEALITWVVKDYTNGSSNIWYTKLNQVNLTWTMTTPSPLTNLPGLNSDVEVVYTYNGNAIAIWKWDTDGNEETWNASLMFSTWNGSSWNQPEFLYKNDGTNKFKELALTSNKDYFALVTTYNQDIGTSVLNFIDMAVFNMNTGSWEHSKSHIYSDTINEFKKPRVAISSNGYAAISYQVCNPYSDTSNIDNGKLAMFISNLNSFTFWNSVQNNNSLFDPNTFIWELTTGFGANNKFYVMTQEYNDNGKVVSPYKGILFGNPSLSMVLRGLQVNSNLTVSDIPEPLSFPTGISRIPNIDIVELLGNYPNPFEQFTTIEFHLKKISNVILEVADVSGNIVSRLVNSKLKQGIYKTDFNSGNLPSGIYFAKLKIDNIILTSKMVKTRSNLSISN